MFDDSVFAFFKSLSNFICGAIFVMEKCVQKHKNGVIYPKAAYRCLATKYHVIRLTAIVGLRVITIVQDSSIGCKELDPLSFVLLLYECSELKVCCITIDNSLATYVVNIHSSYIWHNNIYIYDIV